ncbi:hypothetical protein DPMN_011556, partial [Dreissena polymorpha]
MAFNGKEKLATLKIAIDNDNSVADEYDDDELSLEEEPNFDIDDNYTDIKIAKKATINKVSEQSSDQVQQSHVEENHDVQFNVLLNKVNPSKKEQPFVRPTRVYENKSGDFVTGIDLDFENSVERLQERAKRFGLDYKPEQPVDVQSLYDSLGIKPADLSTKDERGIRMEAVHLRGVHDMNTKDVFSYFNEFAPGKCEWIDDGSCNVVWQDKVTAARAMLKLSRSYEQVMEEYGLKSSKTVSKKQSESMDKAKKSSMKGSGDTEGDSRKVQCEGEDDRRKVQSEGDRQEVCEGEAMEEDQLDLTEDRQEVAAVEKPTQLETQGDRMEDEGTEEGEISDSESEEEIHDSSKTDVLEKIPWPPGKWRLAKPYLNKTMCLFMRFATKADVKLPGAEKRSIFYQKYGNPNYGGIKGLLSQSKKRSLRNQQPAEDLETFGVPAKSMSLSDRNQITYEDDLFSSNVVPEDVEEMDIYIKTDMQGADIRRANKKHESDDDAMESGESDSEFPVIGRVERKEDKADDSGGSEVDEEELTRLLGVRKKPVMRMYADVLEEKQKAN